LENLSLAVENSKLRIEYHGHLSSLLVIKIKPTGGNPVGSVFSRYVSESVPFRTFSISQVNPAGSLSADFFDALHKIPLNNSRKQTSIRAPYAAW
jgi:hypothetical protein